MFIFTPKIGEDEPILTHIFQMGWFNHQLEELVTIVSNIFHKSDTRSDQQRVFFPAWRKLADGFLLDCLEQVVSKVIHKFYPKNTHRVKGFF